MTSFRSSASSWPVLPLTSPRPLPVDRGTRAVLPAPSMPSAADGGLNYDEVGRDPTRTLPVTVGPVPSTLEGDVVSVLWDGIVVGQGAVTAQSAGQNRLFSVDVPVRLL